MFRALSTRRNRRGYEQLGGAGDDETILIEAPADELSQGRSVSSAKTLNNEQLQVINKASKIHPFFTLFETKTTTTKPKKKKRTSSSNSSFSRYLDYVKEAGIWDVGSDKPVIYYK